MKLERKNAESLKAATDMLPITGKKPAELWDDVDTSKPVVVSEVAAFMGTEGGKEAYDLWKKGKLTDRHIGGKFGYGVLDGFYSQRHWDNGVFDSAQADEAELGDVRDGNGFATAGAEREQPEGCTRRDGSCL